MADSESEEEIVPRKRSKIQGVDRISDLPDSIVLHILSLLPTMEDVVTTGALSRRWQYLWTSVPTLNFSLKKLYSGGRYSYRECTNERILRKRRQEFVSFVGNTLTQCHHTKLRRFKLHFYYEPRFASQVNLWIRYAVGANVEELDLDLPGYSFELPKHLFINSSITNLKLQNVIIAPNLSVNWKVLNRLSINGIELDNEVIHNIMLGSPVLECIELCDCFGFTRLDITSKSITSLVLDGFGVRTKDKRDAILNISAPYILSLDIRGNLWLKKLLVLDLPCLIKANLEFVAQSLIKDNENSSLHKDLWKGVIQCVRHVNELAINQCSIKGLNCLELEDWPSSLCMCRSLRISGLEKKGFPALANLLQHSPALESLFVESKSSLCWDDDCFFLKQRDDDCWDDDYNRRHGSAKGNYWACQKMEFQCLQKSLKTVEILYDVERDDECELMQFLLENARVLEKMIIDFGCKKKQCSSSEVSLLKVTRKLLLSIPRASKSAVLHLEGFPSPM